MQTSVLYAEMKILSSFFVCLSVCNNFSLISTPSQCCYSDHLFSVTFHAICLMNKQTKNRLHNVWKLCKNVIIYSSMCQQIINCPSLFRILYLSSRMSVNGKLSLQRIDLSNRHNPHNSNKRVD